MDGMLHRTVRWLSAIVLVAVLGFTSLGGTGRAAQDSSDSATKFDSKAPYAILIDSRSGKVYYENHADDLMAPASMSKVMTMIMVFEGLKSGRLHLNDEFTISENAWRKGGAVSGGSTMYAQLNSRVKLEDLIQGVIIQSANDACIAIAEGIAGSEEAFADQMTRRARELGLQKTTFKNATGLPDPEHKTTARELAQIARYLIEVYPQEYALYSRSDFTWNNIHQQNRNPLLGSYPGADGVKTGHTDESGYGLIGSAVRDGRRLIVVVNGLRSTKDRASESQKLLDYGFRQFRSYELFGANETVGDARVWGGTSSWVKLVARDPVRVLLSDQEKHNARTEIVYRGPLIAPVSEGQEVGFMRLTIDGKVISRVPLITGANVASSAGMWRKALDSVMFMAFGG
jgi:serine-type D-Ala-D-Ala carboxypeptidase (penicillin-binding protein 5/6)